jgi:hypothetical protein
MITGMQGQLVIASLENSRLELLFRPAEERSSKSCHEKKNCSASCLNHES